MKHRNPLPISARRQGGAALIVALTMLLIVTLTGMAAATGSTLQLGMAGATKNRHLAFQAAESALREGERRLSRMEFGCSIDDTLPPDGASHQVPVDGGGSLTVWHADAANLPDPWNRQSWNQADAYDTALAGVNEAPRFTAVVHDVDEATDTVVFRVTAGARAEGGAHAVVESTFRRRFERRIHVRGNADINVVAIGDGILTARAALGTSPNIDIDLGGWNPKDCDHSGEPVTLSYQGTGGTDAFVVGDVLGLGYAAGVDGLLDMTSTVTGLGSALSDYQIRRVEVENPGSTAVAISTLGVSGQFTENNSYCINTKSGETDQGVLDRLVGGAIGGLLPGTQLTQVLQGVADAGEALVGADGVLPLIPANASVIIDGAGNDRYDIVTDTSTAAFVTLDLGGDDSYRMRASGDGFVQMPVIVDIGGNNSYDIEGGHHVHASLDGGALATLNDILADGDVDDLVNNLQGAIDYLNGLLSCGGLLGSLTCALLSSLGDLLNDILDAVSILFDSHVEPGVDAPINQPSSYCHEPSTQRVSWQERLRP